MSEGFLSRWSRLKRSGGPAAPDTPGQGASARGEAVASKGAAPAPVAGLSPATDPGPRGIWSTPVIPGAPASATPQDEAAPVPTGESSQDPAQPTAGASALPPVESLDFEADFKPFMQADVSPATRNAALRKLFSDPSFNVMDGLDVYIDDYSLPDPIPDEMLKGLVQAQALGLFRDQAKQALLEEGAGQALSADGHGVALPVDAGALAHVAQTAEPPEHDASRLRGPASVQPPVPSADQAAVASGGLPDFGAAQPGSVGPRVAAPPAPPEGP